MKEKKMNLRSALISILKIYIVPLIGLILITFSLTGCSEEESTNTPPPANTNAVSIINFAFNPSNRTISAGTTITWTNNDNVAHTVTSGTPGSPDGIFDSGSMAPGESFQFTFTQAGNFNYFCSIHTAMTAQVTVQ